MVFLRALAAQYRSAGEQQPRGGPARVERCPELPSLRVHQERVVEVPDDGVRRPADGCETQQSTDEEQQPSRYDNSSLRSFVLDAGGAFPSYDRQENAEDREQDGEDEQSARGLQVRGQGEQ